VNLMLWLYLQRQLERWRAGLRRLGSILILSSPFFLGLAFRTEPERGLAGRTWRTEAGLFTLLGRHSRTSLRAFAKG
jgi:hypothetical protein